jgi:protein-S-isoprenylcysteine O-methyltransferase Ste14
VSPGLERSGKPPLEEDVSEMESDAAARTTGRYPTDGDTAGVLVRPPLLYLCSILIGSALELVRPLPFAPRSLEAPLGGSLVVAALVLFAFSVREFRAAGTPLPTNRPTTVIVRRGPYRFSRNPIYLAFSLLHLGIAIWTNGGWLLVTLAVTLLVMSYGVIAREERYLAGRFAEEYLAYKASVRRWL